MSEFAKSAPGKRSYVCENCAATFLRWPGSGKNAYCRQSCHYQHRTKLDQDRKRRKCEGCGKIFSPVLKRTRFCSMACSGKRRQLPETRKCPNCGNSKSWGANQCRKCDAMSRITGTEGWCESCGKTLWITAARQRRFCGLACFGLGNRGENNAGFIHGEWTKKYPIEFWQMRLKIRKRDGRACFLCHAKDELHIHHIDRDVENNEAANLVTLCRICHQTQHGPLERSIPLSNHLFSLLSEKYGYPIRYITSL